MKKYAMGLIMFCFLAAVLVVQGRAEGQGANIPTPGVSQDLKIQSTPELLERGEYLVEHVMLCVDCHSERDSTRWGGPIIPGTRGMGGEDFSGPYGTLKARNITPYGIGKWTDYELYKTLVTGMTPDGDQLFMVMPYWKLAMASQQDVFAIMAYIRTFKPIENTPPERKLTVPDAALTPPPFVGSPLPPTPPDPSDWNAYSAYIGNLSMCILCHTPLNPMGMPDLSKSFAGGQVFDMPSGHKVQTANITFDPETGIGLWSKDRFTDFLASYRDPSTWEPVGEHGFNTMMPLSLVSGMSRQDMEAIYDFLKGQPQIRNEIDRFLSE